MVCSRRWGGPELNLRRCRRHSWLRVLSRSTKTLTAELRDPYDNLVDSNANVAFDQTSGAGSVTGLGTAAAVHGVATDVVTGNLAGSVTITASSGELSPDTTTFSVVAGTATQLAFTSSTTDLASGTSRTLTAQVEDAEGNLITSPSYHVTIAKLSGTGTVSLGSASSGAGITSRSATGVLAGSVSIQASASGLTSATTTFDVVPGAAAKLVFSSSTAALASGDARDVTAQIRDAAGNLVPSDGGHSISFTRSSGTGSVTGLPGSAPSSSGSASVSVTGMTAGSVTIKAYSSGLAPATTTFKVVPGAAAKLVFTSSTGSLVVGHQRKLAVEVLDAAGNLVKSPSVSVTFAKCSGDGTASGLPQSPTSGDGKATANITATGAGTITICATASGLSSAATSFKIKN